MKETLLKSAMYQIIIPLDTSIEKVIDTENFTIKEFKNDDNLFLIERIRTEEVKQEETPEQLIKIGVNKRKRIIDKIL
jgi:hypothetical protein